ncbi:class I SAM-dependent methyltransferase [Uliginosibacterium sp. H3]|uniref:Class I SAM-dependent methyltransferase n=1 Tax=Uliginosibacterium silvisoli TaxID=3114758 RepID=A0ABU6K816_9RHOO|nr:class I SAM-dependent methyltransferase [Uliginosibacterium sp. H3]
MSEHSAPTAARLFSRVAEGHAKFRPCYPDSLLDYLAGLAPRRQLAWDCACGSGRATQGLAERFVSVIGTDLSAAQIALATPRRDVRYQVAPAHESGIESGTVDLVTVAQALHWFDLEAFYAEVRRVLVPRGVLAVWSYGAPDIEDEEISALLEEFRTRIVGAYWPKERRHVDNGYADLPFPFEESSEAAPAFKLEICWSLPQLLGYLRSWTASEAYRQATGVDPVLLLAARLVHVWGEAYHQHRISWPLRLRTGRLAA